MTITLFSFEIMMYRWHSKTLGISRNRFHYFWVVLTKFQWKYTPILSSLAPHLISCGLYYGLLLITGIEILTPSKSAISFFKNGFGNEKLRIKK